METKKIPDVINGIRLQVVADVALGVFDPRVFAPSIGPGDEVTEICGPGLIALPSKAEKSIAKIASATLVSLRRKGYAREQCRLGFWNKIVSEARKTRQ